MAIYNLKRLDFHQQPNSLRKNTTRVHLGYRITATITTLTEEPSIQTLCAEVRGLWWAEGPQDYRITGLRVSRAPLHYAY